MMMIEMHNIHTPDSAYNEKGRWMDADEDDDEE